MNTYIFITYNIHNGGGGQAYVSAKAGYLKRLGWRVVVLFYGSKEKGCVIKDLDEYVAGGYTLLWTVPWKINRLVRNDFLRKIIKEHSLKKCKKNKSDYIIIESHDSSTAPWGELLAKRLNAKHITPLLNESYDGPARFYKEKLDFYEFKLKRRELPFNLKKSRLLFGDDSYYEKYGDNAFRIDEDPVRDISAPDIDLISHNDWNVGYVGRASKGYLPNIIDGICDFSKKHADHHIQFIVIGDFECRRDYFKQKSSGISNLTLIELSNRFPLPRSFFKKVDVVIAGSGSARCSIKEGVPVLVADAGNFLCNGRLGFDTLQSVFKDDDTKQMSYSDGLERLFVLNSYRGMHNKYLPGPGVEECTKQNFDFIEASSQSKKYYSERKLCKPINKRLGIKTYIKIELGFHFPKLYKRLVDYKRNRVNN